MADRYEYYDSGQDHKSSVDALAWYAQKFTVGTVGTDEDHAIDSIKIYACKDGSPGTMTASIQGVDGNDKPDGSDLSSGTVDADGFPAAYNYAMQAVSMSAYTLEAATSYYLVCRCLDAVAGNDVFWGSDKTTPTYGGGTGAYSLDAGSSWSLDSTVDALFEIWGDPLGTAHTHTAADTLAIADAVAYKMDHVQALADTLAISDSVAYVLTKGEVPVIKRKGMPYGLKPARIPRIGRIGV